MIEGEFLRRAARVHKWRNIHTYIHMGKVWELTSRNRRETVEPVSDCSPIAVTRFSGSRESIRTTGFPVVSCRRSDSELMR